jgi:hypothetical protein
MPRLPIDYSKTVIYKIVCNDLRITDCYVGRTTDHIRRKHNHKCSCNNEKGKYYDLKVYATIRKNGGWNNWSMIEIEKYPCKDANEATAKEREWFERLNSSLNMIYPQRCKEEYKVEHREHSNQRDREYYVKNKIDINQRKSQLVICECGCSISKYNFAKHRRTQKHIDFISALNANSDSVPTDSI